MTLKLAFKSGQKQENNFLASEFVGRELEVVSSSCKDLLKASGRIIDETVNTFVIQTSDRKKTIPKKNCLFRIDRYEVAGDLIVGRPEDRIKKFT